jgi:hypothetical protein
MSIDDLNTFLAQYLRTQFDPSAPLPDLWPTGAFGVFLIFVLPTIVGIPLGVIMARDAALPPLLTVGLYFASDLVLAVTAEPMLAVVRWVGRHVELLNRLGKKLSRFTETTGLQEGGVRGPLGLILVSFTVNPLAGRAAAAAAGHGFFSGWALAIIGDMIYFGLIMVSTLWISSIFGNDRLAIGIVLIVAFLAPILLRRMRRKPAQTSAPHRAHLSVPAPTAPSLANASSAPLLKRKRTSHTGRRRPSRGVHR